MKLHYIYSIFLLAMPVSCWASGKNFYFGHYLYSTAWTKSLVIVSLRVAESPELKGGWRWYDWNTGWREPRCVVASIKRSVTGCLFSYWYGSASSVHTVQPFILLTMSTWCAGSAAMDMAHHITMCLGSALHYSWIMNFINTIYLSTYTVMCCCDTTYGWNTWHCALQTIS